MGFNLFDFIGRMASGPFTQKDSIFNIIKKDQVNIWAIFEKYFISMFSGFDNILTNTMSTAQSSWKFGLKDEFVNETS